MFPSKRPKNLEQLVERIAAGEITRAQAAALAEVDGQAEPGMAWSTFIGWLSRTGALERLKATRGNVGARHRNAADPARAQRMQQAVQEALAAPTTSRATRKVWAKYKDDISYVYLCRLVNDARRSEVDRATAKVLERALNAPDNASRQ